MADEAPFADAASGRPGADGRSTPSAGDPAAVEVSGRGLPGGRRAAAKARSRARIVSAAHALFDQRGFTGVTLAEIAQAAQFSVPTLLAHFESKEAMFFADRSQWVDGPAAAVRGRAPGEAALSALRRHLVRRVGAYVQEARSPAHRQLVARLNQSPSLLAYERNLHEEATQRLSAALAECGEQADALTRLTADVTASVWLSALRTLLIRLREEPPESKTAVQQVIAFVEQFFSELQRIAPRRLAGHDGDAIRLD